MRRLTNGRAPWRVLMVLLALALVAGACGDDGDTVEASGETAAAEGHDHDEPVDVSGLDPTPTVTVEVTEDPKSGWNLHFEAEGHELAPERASTEHVEGEGHAHLYVDGEKVTRLYTEDFYLGEMEPGTHEVMVELSANDHRPLAVDGEVVMEAVTVEVPEEEAADEMAAGGHDHAEPVDVSGLDPAPAVAVEVTEDPKSGWNLHLDVEGHEFAPERASTEHVEGEGHAHLYVDGEKVTRLYGADFHLGELEPGTREVMVELSANDHRPLAVDGEAVMETVTVDVAGEAGDDGHGDDGHDDGHGHDDAGSGDAVDEAAADHVVDVTVEDGEVTGDTGTRDVALGDVVLVRVTSDVADEVHVHGVEVLKGVDAGGTAALQFTADQPGVYEVELESGGLLLFELAVS